MEKTPKVFISYSWSSPEHEEKVLNLATRLMSHGVEVIIDKWDLKEGQDKYAFMEQAVTSNDIDRVLIISDKMYAEKANSRRGGVGDETIIISPEIYGSVNQNKFIPVVFEYDECRNPCLPAYIKSRIYINLSSEEDFENEYEKLLRNIHNKPMFKKPGVGRIPEWILDETTDYSLLKDIIKQLKGTQYDKKGKFMILIKRFIDSFCEVMNELRITEAKGDMSEEIVKKINKMKPLRDIYLDFLETLLYVDADISNIIPQYFESIYNNVYTEENKNSYIEIEYDHFEFMIWEMFICTILVLLHNERYENIKDIVSNTYFLKSSLFGDEKPADFTKFRPYLRSLEEIIKPKSDNPRLFSLTAEMLMEREKLPVLSKKKLVEADVLLCQLGEIYTDNKWFPMTYVYNEDSGAMWRKLVSRKYCEKTMVMYGASSVEELKIIAEKNDYKREVRYNYAFDSAPSIASTISINEIATLP